MNKIFQLNDVIVNRIAAGEVVTRPASVVKELIENSIDAKSSYITIEIEKGGVDLIRISDNGTGILAEDVPIAFLKHATSKISTTDELDHIQSLGFRGEALPSIASVSDVELTTRSENAQNGVFFHIRAGKVLENKPIGCPEGTNISVKNLFFNTPARLKFLKSSGIEASYVTDVVSRYIMAHPEISFKYVSSGKIIFHSTGNGDLKTAMYSVYGKEAATETLELNYSHNDLQLHGIIGKPSISKPNRRYESVFVNGRYVQNNTISLAVRDAMDTLLMTRRFPLFAISITIPYDAVDVNVHPAKLVVKFRDEKYIYDVIYRAVKTLFTPSAAKFEQELPKDDEIQETDLNKDWPIVTDKDIEQEQEEKYSLNSEQNEAPRSGTQMYSQLNTQNISGIRQVVIHSNFSEQMKVEEAYEFSAFESGILEEELEFSIIGQVFNTYIIVQVDDNMLIIDQHAAHERINYDMFKKNINEHKTVSQQLLVPYILEVSHLERELIESNIKVFEDIGFEIDLIGDKSFRVGAVPSMLGEPQLRECFDEMLESLFEFKKITSFDIKREALIQKACKASIKGGDRLDRHEIEKLILYYKQNNVTLTCPHGRPIVHAISKHELEKIFKRIV